MASLADLVYETATTTGTGNFTLASVTGWVSFNTAFGTGGTDAFYYFIRHQNADEWEVGTGHLSASTTLVRDTVIASSNSDAAVNFSAGTKEVTCDLPAERQAAPGTWTPAVTFQTPGDLSIAYAIQSGTYTRTGRLVTVFFNIVSSSFTHSSASGAVLISGLPFNCAATDHFVGTMIAAGITKSSYTQFLPRARDTFSGQLEVTAQGSGVASANVLAADMPSGGTVNFRGMVAYEV